jgi:cell division protein ZapA
MVNGRAYTIACDEGEEDHLKELASHGDTRMLLMAALLMADEHHDMTAKLAEGEQPADDGEKQRLRLRAEQAESGAADMMESAAKKLEDIAARLARA